MLVSKNAEVHEWPHYARCIAVSREPDNVRLGPEAPHRRYKAVARRGHAANGSFEPSLPNAALHTNVRFADISKARHRKDTTSYSYHNFRDAALRVIDLTQSWQVAGCVQSSQDRRSYYDCQKQIRSLVIAQTDAPGKSFNGPYSCGEWPWKPINCIAVGLSTTSSSW